MVAIDPDTVVSHGTVDAAFALPPAGAVAAVDAVMEAMGQPPPSPRSARRATMRSE